MAHNTVYFITDAYGRTIDERNEFASIDEAREYAGQIDCPCGVWVCPSIWDDDDGGYVSVGADEEIHPAREG